MSEKTKLLGHMVAYTNEKYTNKEGQEKSKTIIIGSLLQTDSKVWGKIDNIPVNWDGKFNVFEPKDKE